MKRFGEGGLTFYLFFDDLTWNDPIERVTCSHAHMIHPTSNAFQLGICCAKYRPNSRKWSMICMHEILHTLYDALNRI